MVGAEVTLDNVAMCRLAVTIMAAVTAIAKTKAVSRHATWLHQSCQQSKVITRKSPGHTPGARIQSHHYFSVMILDIMRKITKTIMIVLDIRPGRR